MAGLWPTAPGGAESGGRARPGGSTGHCVEMAPASLTPPSFLPSKDPDLTLQNYPPQQADWEGLASEPDTGEGRGISGLRASSQTESWGAVWTVWSPN